MIRGPRAVVAAVAVLVGVVAVVLFGRAAEAGIVVVPVVTVAAAAVALAWAVGLVDLRVLLGVVAAALGVVGLTVFRRRVVRLPPEVVADDPRPMVDDVADAGVEVVDRRYREDVAETAAAHVDGDLGATYAGRVAGRGRRSPLWPFVVLALSSGRATAGTPAEAHDGPGNDLVDVGPPSPPAVPDPVAGECDPSGWAAHGGPAVDLRPGDRLPPGLVGPDGTLTCRVVLVQPAEFRYLVDRDAFADAFGDWYAVRGVADLRIAEYERDSYRARVEALTTPPHWTARPEVQRWAGRLDTLLAVGVAAWALDKVGG